jgi:hypothetical protein
MHLVTALSRAGLSGVYYASMLLLEVHMRAFACFLALVGACSSRRTLGLLILLAVAEFLSTSCGILSPDPLQVQVAVQPLRFAVGDPAEITVTVVNLTTHRLQLRGDACMISFMVLDSAGSLVTPEGYCVTVLAFQDIEPGGELVTEFSWRGTRGTTGGYSPPPSYLPPGSYSVVGVFDGAPQPARSLPVSIELL